MRKRVLDDAGRGLYDYRNEEMPVRGADLNVAQRIQNVTR